MIQIKTKTIAMLMVAIATVGVTASSMSSVIPAHATNTQPSSCPSTSVCLSNTGHNCSSFNQACSDGHTTINQDTVTGISSSSISGNNVVGFDTGGGHVTSSTNPPAGTGQCNINGSPSFKGTIDPTGTCIKGQGGAK